MKVQDITSSLEPKRPVTHSRKDNTAFSALVKQGQARLQTEALHRLYADIEKQADRVVHSRTMESFLLFKRQVRHFIEEAVGSSFELRQSRQWDRGGSKTMTLVKKIDDKLTEMTEQFLRKGQQAIDLLDAIGEIKGLLINLYR